MTPEERIAELLRALPAAPEGLGRGGEGAARARGASSRRSSSGSSTTSGCARAGDRRPRGAAPRRGRRADAGRRRPPAPPARAMTLDDERRRARRRRRWAGSHDVLAEPGPGPAGGSAAALATAMAAGLVRLVARVSPDWEEAPGIAAQAAALGDRSLLLADDDHRVYARRRSRSSTRPSATRRSARRCATPRACRSQIAETAADVAALAALAAREGAERCAATRGRRRRSPRRRRPRRPASCSVNLATRPDDDLRTRRRPRGARGGDRRARASRSRRRERAARPGVEPRAGRARRRSRRRARGRSDHREWAIGGSRGAVDVCIVDSGVEAGHPLVGALASAVAVVREDDEIRVVEDELGDVCGHGTACAGIVRSLAPDCRLHSVRVLGAGREGSGDLILAGLRHAVEAGHRVISLSLSTTKQRFAEELHELADTAYFNRTVVVASAHNLPVSSYPWRFSSVISVGSHEEREPLTWYANPSPPVELFARGVDVEVAWPGGGTLRCTGNSFAAPHIAGDRGARAREASRADAVPAEERPPPDRGERARPSRRPDERRARRRARGRRAARRRRGDLPRAAAVDRRRRAHDLRRARPRRSSSSTRRPTSSSSRPSRARARGPRRRALPVEHRDRRLRARDPPAPRRRRPRRPTRGSRATRAESTGYVPDEHRRDAAAPRRARARRALGARPRAATARSGSPSWSCSPASRRRRRSRSTCCCGAPGATRRRSAATGDAALVGRLAALLDARTPTPAGSCSRRSSGCWRARRHARSGALHTHERRRRRRFAPSNRPPAGEPSRSWRAARPRSGRPRSRPASSLGAERPRSRRPRAGGPRSRPRSVGLDCRRRSLVLEPLALVRHLVAPFDGMPWSGHTCPPDARAG